MLTIEEREFMAKVVNKLDIIIELLKNVKNKI